MGLLRQVFIVAMIVLLPSGGAVAQEEFDAERNEILRLRIRLDSARYLLGFYQQQKDRVHREGLDNQQEFLERERFSHSLCGPAPAIETSAQFRFRQEACASFQAFVAGIYRPTELALATRYFEASEALEQQSAAIERLQRELDEAIVTYMTQVAWQAIQAGQVRQPTLPPGRTKSTTRAQPGTKRRPPAVKSRPPVRQAKPGVRPPPSRSPWEGAAEAVRRGLPTAIGGTQIRVR